MEFVEVARVQDIAPGRAKRVDVAGQPVALVHHERGFFAVDGICPHRGGPLGEGDVIGDEIVCPWHLWGFDLATGKCPGNPEISLSTHEVRVEGERLLVRLSGTREAANAT